MNYEPENSGRLRAMKPAKSVDDGNSVWACMPAPLFKTHDGYFGRHVWGDPHDPWELRCLEGKSPVVFKPMRLFYAGRFDLAGGFDSLYVFKKSIEECPEYGVAMPWSSDCYRCVRTELTANSLVPYILTDGRWLDYHEAFFTKDECVVKCREMNTRSCKGCAIAQDGKWYRKTLEDMSRQLEECLASDWVADPAETLKKAVKGDPE